MAHFSKPHAAKVLVLTWAIFMGPAAARSEDQTNTDGGKLVICAIPNAMPRTGRVSDSPEGLDVAVAQLVAKQLGRKIEWHWCASAACSWNCVRDRRCDVVIGQPHSSGPRELAWSIPYAGSRFGLVVHNDSKNIKSLADLKGKRVGLVAGTIALPSKDYTPVYCKTREEIMDGFVDKRLDAALLDDDFAAWYLHKHPRLSLRRVAEYVPRQRWNMGFAVRGKHKTLLADINRALRRVLSTGQVSKAFSEQGVRYRAAFENTDRTTQPYNTWERIGARGELIVSMDPANLPYSSAKGDRPGFDVELAQALADELGVKLRIDWIDVQRETAIGELLDHECDLALGAAIDPGAVDDEQELAGKVIYSRPYYGTGYLLVVRRDGPRIKSLRELTGKKSRRLGTDAGSIADYRLRQRGYLRRLFRNQLATLKSLHDGGIDYAYLWANVGWVLHATPEFDLELVPDYKPEDHWNIAIAMRHGDDQLKKHVDATVEKLVKSDAVSRALARYHIPYFSPFQQKQNKAESPATRRQPQNRGIEPQMYRRQRSKNRYVGLERLRTAGELVVGLDHNNLPFSAVRPKSSGLDYEIAGLLAKKLGVTLRVYWAYSSHDSYPSKLATKRFCDVMLGVMPDDRFAGRVIYSQPYYYASYQRVILAGANLPKDASPLAVERGVAVRGIRGREVRELDSLDAILEAIVKGRQRVGYVISTRGRWLAEQRWPGKLAFVGQASQSADRFPICAAVRKEDHTLKEAIDDAFADLAQSGELAKVFKRWHIPYTASQEKSESSK